MTRTTILVIALATFALVGCKKPVAPDDALGNGSGHTSNTADPNADAVSKLKYQFTRVQFAFDSSELNDGSKTALREGVKILQENPDVRVEVQGHADEQGTTEYNLALGDRRALAVLRYMTSLGASTAQVKSVSYGEERPLVTGKSETAYSQNRRAEFRIISGEGVMSGTVN